MQHGLRSVSLAGRNVRRGAVLLSTVLVVAVVATITGVLVSQAAQSTFNEAESREVAAVEVAALEAFIPLEVSLAADPSGYLNTPVTGESTRMSCTSPASPWVSAVDGPYWCYATASPSGTTGDLLHLTQPSSDSRHLTANVVFTSGTTTTSATRVYGNLATTRTQIWSSANIDLGAASSHIHHPGGPEATVISGPIASLGQITTPDATDTGAYVTDAQLVAGATVVLDVTSTAVTGSTAYEAAAAGTSTAAPRSFADNTVGSTVSFSAPHQSLADVRSTAILNSPLDAGSATCTAGITTAHCYDTAYVQAVTNVQTVEDDEETEDDDESEFKFLTPTRYMITFSGNSYTVYARASATALDGSDPTTVADALSAPGADTSGLLGSYPAVLATLPVPSILNPTGSYFSNWWPVASNTVPESGIIWFDRDVQIGFCGNSFYSTGAGCAPQTLTKHVRVGAGTANQPRSAYIGTSVYESTGSLSIVATGSAIFPWYAATPAGVHAVTADIFALGYDSPTSAIRTQPTSLSNWPADPATPYADEDLVSGSLTFTGALVGESIDFTFHTYESVSVN